MSSVFGRRSGCTVNNTCVVVDYQYVVAMFRRRHGYRVIHQSKQADSVGRGNTFGQLAE